MKPKKSSVSGLTYFIIFTLLVILIFFVFFNDNSAKNKITITQANEYFTSNQVENWYIVGTSKIVFDLKDSATLPDGQKQNIPASDFPKKFDCYVTYNAMVVSGWVDNYQDSLLDYEQPSASIWETLYPIIMIVLAAVFIFFLFKMFSGKGNGAMGFGKSRARQAVNVKVRFSDIAGAEEEKEELQELVDFLKNPQKFSNLGARIPKGVLLVGPPGTGKTLLARAVAGESGVPFLSISGSDFVEMFVGVGASRVRDLFEQAKASAPCIVFIDEIDAVGRQRGAGLGGSNDEREQTLNQLLVELDGFEANNGIIVLAATNRSDVLDPALMRPGRFDRQVYVYPPDVRGREGILKIHAKNKPLADDVDFKTLARITSGFTGADIENMLNEAAILAARSGRVKINMTDITEGINKVLMGPQKKSALMTENDKKIAAYHEAGHAILHEKLEYVDGVQEVSIIPRGRAGGYTLSRPDNDDEFLTFNKINDELAVFTGGRIGEIIGLNKFSAGASNDIERATALARKMVTEWGMSEHFGFMGFGSGGQVFIGRDYQEKNAYSEKLAGEIDQEIKSILDYNYKRAEKIIKENKDILENLAQLLLAKETIYKEEIQLLFDGKTVDDVIAIMNKKEKSKKNREKKDKLIAEKTDDLKELEVKVKTSEVFLKHNIISEEEFKKIVELRDKKKAELIEKQTNHEEVEENINEQAKNELKPEEQNNIEIQADLVEDSNIEEEKDSRSKQGDENEEKNR